MAKLYWQKKSWVAFDITLATTSEHLRRWFAQIHDTSSSLTSIKIEGELMVLKFYGWGEESDSAGCHLHYCTWRLFPKDNGGDLSKKNHAYVASAGLWIDFSDISPNLVHVKCWCDALFPEVIETAQQVYSRIISIFPVDKKIAGELVVSTIHDIDRMAHPTLPKTHTVRDRYRRAWLIIIDLREEYREEFLEGRTDNPLPSKRECAEAIAHLWSRIPNRKTVERVIECGEAGLFDK